MYIITMTNEHYPAVQRIHQEGIDTKNASFLTEALSFTEWDAKYLPTCRFVAIQDNQILGFSALLPFSTMEAYDGVAELSIYVSSDAQGFGVGKKLMAHTIAKSEQAGFWTLQSLIFPENKASIHLHESFGFKKMCLHKKLGKMDGKFRDVALLERRSSLI